MEENGEMLGQSLDNGRVWLVRGHGPAFLTSTGYDLEGLSEGRYGGALAFRYVASSIDSYIPMETIRMKKF